MTYCVNQSSHGVAAAGSPRHDSALRQLCVGFDSDTFAFIKRKAAENRCSVTEQIRTYVEWGIESEKLDLARCAAKRRRA